jgi:hypothetical protein
VVAQDNAAVCRGMMTAQDERTVYRGILMFLIMIAATFALGVALMGTMAILMAILIAISDDSVLESFASLYCTKLPPFP